MTEIAASKGPAADMFVVGLDGTVRNKAGDVLFTREPDGTVRDTRGRAIIFSIDRFVNDICLGGHCFICGVSPKDATFNDEHIVPRWVLQFTDQFNGRIGLPNQTDFRGYGAYKIPCCVPCNSELGRVFEEILAPLFRGGYAVLREYLVKEGALALFRWLALMYLKTHLRDARLKWTRDPRKDDGTKIGDVYEWQALHHVHCIARSHYTGIDFDTRQIGSMLILPVLAGPDLPTFDYADMFLGRAIMIRVGEIACLAVLNDASIVAANFPRANEVLRSADLLNPWQLRELYAGLVWRNASLTTRPRFMTSLVPKPHFQVVMPERISFEALKPDDIVPHLPPSFGEFLYQICRDFIEGQSPERVAEAKAFAAENRLTFFTTQVPYWPEE